MKRKVYLNEVPNVQMYASEGGSNSGNCASGCGSGGTVNSGNCANGCGGGSGGSDDGWVIAMVSAGATVVGGVITTVIGGTIAGPPGAVAASTAGPGPTLA